MAVEEDTFRSSALLLLALDPYLGDATEHHIEEVIEAEEGAGELTLALHDHPHGVVDALVQHAQRHDLKAAHPNYYKINQPIFTHSKAH